VANKNTIRVAEFEKLYYDNDKPFKQKHWEALCRYLESTNKKEEKRVEYFRILNRGIQFTNYVGVIQAGNLTIEILPKTDRQSTNADNLSIEELEKSNKEVSNNKQCWHNVLLQMLKECSLLKVNHVDYA
jgi:5-methylcytosine-specific restriction enzyme subunit McrC